MSPAPAWTVGGLLVLVLAVGVVVLALRARRRGGPAAPPTTPAAGSSAVPPSRGAGAGAGAADDHGGPRTPAGPRRYHAPAPDDPGLDTRLGALLEALDAGPLTRDELGRRVGAADWGPDGLAATVAHGVASGVLREDGDGRVRTRWSD